MVKRINSIIFDNIREETRFDFDPTVIELVSKINTYQIKTLKRENKDSQRIVMNIYRFSHTDDKKEALINEPSKYFVSRRNPLYGRLKQELIGARQW